MADRDALRTEMQSAISEVLRKHGEAMVTKFVVIAEAMDNDGTRALWTISPLECKPWEVLGMLEFGKALEYSQPRASNDEDD